jgi:hypothetical protein
MPVKMRIDVPGRVLKLLERHGVEFKWRDDGGPYHFMFATKCMLTVYPRGTFSWYRRHLFEPQALAYEIEKAAIDGAEILKADRKFVRRARRTWNLSKGNQRRYTNLTSKRHRP